MTKKTAYWLCQIFGWSAYGFLNFGVYFIQSGRLNGTEFLIAVGQILFYVISSHLLRRIIKQRGWIGLPILRLLPQILGLNLAFGLANYLFLLLISFLSGILVLSVELRTINIMFGVLGPATMYCLWSLVYFTYHFFEEYNKSLQYETKIKEAELQQLRSQLNPHFIFNALNSIKALVDEEPAKSKMAITQLSSIFRNTLTAEKKRFVLLEEEMETVKAYLGLELIRFEERLNVNLDLPDDTLSCKIPPMMMQTLVENGVKHGISKLKKGGKIEVKAHLESDQLVLEIRNTGVLEENRVLEEGHGTGLQNTKDRLQLIYGDRASFIIFNEKENVVLTQIIVPKEY